MINPETVEQAVRNEFDPGHTSEYAWSDVPESGSFSLTIDGELQSVEVVENTTTYEFPDGYSAYDYPTHSQRIVLHMEGTGQFFLKESTYRSHDGRDWSPLKGVTPKTVTVTTWE